VEGYALRPASAQVGGAMLAEVARGPCLSGANLAVSAQISGTYVVRVRQGPQLHVIATYSTHVFFMQHMQRTPAYYTCRTCQD
jgi:hypothetical protein